MEDAPNLPPPISASSQTPGQQPDGDFGRVPTSNPPSLSIPHFQPSRRPTSSAVRVSKPSNTKVAIPRQQSAVTPRFNRRVPRACESCRQRKTKCSGDNPVCRQCRELRIHCQYPVGWREKTKRHIESLSTKAQELENILREVGNTVEGRTAERIRALLDKYTPDTETPSTGVTSHSSVTPQDEVGEQEVSSPSSIGSLEAIDRVEEDLNRNKDSRATGYIGKNSEVTWMQRVQQEAEQRSRGQAGTYEPDSDNIQSGEFAIHSMNYHLDDLGISVPGPVQMYWIPPRQLADQLFEDYLTTVHPFFPIINRPLFTAQYKTFFDSDARPGDKWLAILNLIFAISATHAHLIRAPWCGDEQDHLVYLTRARFLSMNGDVLFCHPDLQQIQVEGLIAFYLLASDQINRAWRISALAVRSAISLGINMKITTKSTPGISKESRYRVWWCLYTFEHMLGIMTGRATCILDGICTSPLPLPFEEENMRDSVPTQLLNDPALREERIGSAVASSLVRLIPPNPAGGKEAEPSGKIRDNDWLKSVPTSSALCFLYYVDLAVVAQEIVNKVYSTESAMTPWTHIENRIGELKSRIDLWYSSLPEGFDFANKNSGEPDTLREKLRLALHYYSARITLGRPCLCRRDAGSTGPNRKETFSHKMAVVTLESSLQMLDLIPDEPDALRLYQISPWWCILHYLMQATTVLLLELSFGSVHMPKDETKILQAAKKAIRWLFSMSEHSIASRRAWQLCDSSLRRIAIGMNCDVNDMPAFSYEKKPDQPINIGNGDPGVSSAPGAPMFWTANTGDRPMSEPGYDFHSHTEYTMPPSTNPVNAEAADNILADVYFPYDPISGEFIRSFFPNPSEEENWSPWAE